MSEHREIDVRFQGVEHAICSHVVDGWLVDPGPESSLAALVAALDGPPRGVLLTHIHLDHAGGTGALLERWPQLPVYVHERGARHLVDPARLIASARRIYGDRMERLWGRIVPVAAENVRVLAEGAAAPDGFTWAPTPGHAVHHVAYRHEATGLVLAGDVAGVRIGDGPVLPPTPPPDIDVGRWHASLELLDGWQPAALAITHYGTFTDAGAQIERAHGELDRLAELARTVDAAGFEQAIRTTLAPAAEAAGYFVAMPPETLYAGLARYWTIEDNRREP